MELKAEMKMTEMRNQIDSKSLILPDKRIHILSFWAFTFALLMAIGAQIEIPNQPVPFTLQTFFVFLAGAFLGKRGAAISMSFYLILGASGLPVFSGGAFGLVKILGPTGGYLLSFPIAAFAIGYLTRVRGEYWWMLLSMCVGSFIIYSLGTLQLNFLYFHNWMNSFQAGFLIFSWWDGVKIIGAATIAYTYFQRMKNHES
jgi:biotin transport system substrate-specific component